MIMERDSDIDRLEHEIREMFHARRLSFAVELERHIENSLSSLSWKERADMVETVAQRFKKTTSEYGDGADSPSPDFVKLACLMLGRKIDATDLTSADASEKLAQSVNAVFDMLNQIMIVIRNTLPVSEGEQETIRYIIGSHIEGQGEENSLQLYLSQIREAFLTVHKAAVTAAASVVQHVLSGLDPDGIAAATGSSLKLWPMSEGKLFSAYKEKYKTCKEWCGTGGVEEEFLREFEKAYQALYRKETRRIE